MKRILWLSRHKPLPVQEAELKRLFGDAKPFRDVTPFRNAEDIKRRYEQGGYDDLVVVAPLWVIYYLTEMGIQPLWAEMKPVSADEEWHTFYNGRYYKFRKFRRIKKVTIEYENLSPDLY